MSIHTISTVLKKQWGNASRKMIAIKLADVSNDTGGSIYPSIRTVAAEAELSERQVKRIIGEFRETGLLQVVKKGGNGPGRTTEYRFDMEAVSRLPDAAPKRDTMTPLRLVRVTSTTKKGDMGVTQPVIEPIILSSRERSASGEAGADAPQEGLENELISPPEPLSQPSESRSVSAMVWKEALELLSTSPVPEPQFRSLIGKWLKQAASGEAKEKLLGMVRAARQAGTHEPIAYVTKALNEACPPAPGPEEFDQHKWNAVASIALRTGEWAKAWGKPPGRKGCLMPAKLITPDLLEALGQGARAA